MFCPPTMRRQRKPDIASLRTCRRPQLACYVCLCSPVTKRHTPWDPDIPVHRCYCSCHSPASASGDRLPQRFIVGSLSPAFNCARRPVHRGRGVLEHINVRVRKMRARSPPSTSPCHTHSVTLLTLCNTLASISFLLLLYLSIPLRLPAHSSP